MLRTKGRRRARHRSTGRDLPELWGVEPVSRGQLYEVDMVRSSLKIKIFKGSERPANTF